MNEGYKDIIEGIDDIIIISDNRIIKYINSAASKFLGYSKEDFLEKDALDFIKEDYQKETKNNYKKIAEGDKTYLYEAGFKKADGSFIAGEIRLQPIEYFGKTMELMIIREIGARKKTEEVFWKQEERFRTVADNTPDLIARFDIEGRYVYVNKAAEEIYGIEKKDFFWKKDEDLNINKENRETFKDAIDFVFKNKKKKKFYSESVVGGSKRYFSTILVPEFLPDGTINSVLSITRDITEIREIDEVKSEFISITTHQLRSPLSVINWCSIALLREDAGEINSEQKEYLEKIYSSTRDLIKITDVFLNTTMLDLEMFVFNPKKMSIKEVAEEVNRDFKRIAEKKGLNFYEDYKESIENIKIDPRVFKIIIKGIVANAIEYTPKGGSVEFIAKTKGEENFFLEIGDSGCGISKDHQEKIFTKFYRTKEARRLKPYGTGLDLYLIKSLLNKIGGDIRVESPNPKFGKGTVFYIEFPMFWNKE